VQQMGHRGCQMYLLQFRSPFMYSACLL